MTFLGGYGFESGDPNLHDKIAKLKARRGAQSSKERVESFLEKELHVDPRDLPFGLDFANARMKEIMDGVGVDLVDVQGNSLGLKAVVFRSGNLPDGTCTRCNRTYGYWGEPVAPLNRHVWFCYECDDQDVNVPVPDVVIKTVTENDHGGEDWHDLKRCWSAFVNHLKTVEAADFTPLGIDDERATVYSFTVTKVWSGASTTPVPPVIPEPDVTKYPPGATLRIRLATFKDGDVDIQELYVRVGGLFDETDIVNLETMQVVPNPEGWLVVEEL